MRRKIMVALTVVFIAAIVSFLIPALGSKAQAQQNCPSFQAILQGRFPLEAPLPLRDGDGWGGNVYGFLGDEPLVGIYSGDDGTVSWHKWVGMGKGGTYKFAFGPLDNNNTFTIVATQATFPNPPGIFPSGGMYQANWKIAQGTGRFQYATGNMFAKGPYIVSTTDNWATVFGRWNAEITGNICGVQ